MGAAVRGREEAGQFGGGPFPWQTHDVAVSAGDFFEDEFAVFLDGVGAGLVQRFDPAGEHGEGRRCLWDAALLTPQPALALATSPRFRFLSGYSSPLVEKRLAGRPNGIMVAMPMKLAHALHLAYSTKVHPAETWAETFAALKTHTLAVRERVCPGRPYGIGLRLSSRAARELADRATLTAFQRWLGENQCYVFTLNGFCHGHTGGVTAEEKAYAPDWTSPERLAYTNLLFDLLAQLLPTEVEGSVSTLPGSFKEFVHHTDEARAIRTNLWRCVEHVARVCELTGRRLHLGVEPSPLCLLETSGEVVYFFDRLRAERHYDPRLYEFLGVAYDTCHFAMEFEEPLNALACLQQHRIRVSKIHLGNALCARPTRLMREHLRAFANDSQLHQVVVCRPGGKRVIYRDLPDALISEPAEDGEPEVGETRLPEWRIHFHLPLHSEPQPPFASTSAHTTGVLDALAINPALCPHLEMESTAWQFLPEERQFAEVAEALAADYNWTLARLTERGLA